MDNKMRYYHDKAPVRYKGKLVFLLAGLPVPALGSEDEGYYTHIDEGHAVEMQTERFQIPAVDEAEDWPVTSTELSALNDDGIEDDGIDSEGENEFGESRTILIAREFTTRLSLSDRRRYALN